MAPRVALSAGSIDRVAVVAAKASQLAGRGGGSVIGGHVALRLDPGSLRRLTAGRRVALVSGTNGKTTTTKLLATALGTRHRVVSNSSGANMPAGLVAALATDPRADLAVLEVDEGHLPAVSAEVEPALVLLLNLSRDQLDRVGEVAMVANRWRAALVAHPVPVVANADDPTIVQAAGGAPNVTWVAAGQRWRADSETCGRCGRRLHRPDDAADWWCDCGQRRPPVDWNLDGETLIGPGGHRLLLRLVLPGVANRANAAMAVAAAVRLGVPAETAAAALDSVQSVAGRYLVTQVGAHRVRVLLAKNPAGWLETMNMLEPGGGDVVLALNSRIADGRDVSWLWDIPIERLHGRRIVVCGERRLDLAVRLELAGLPVTVAEDPLAALAAIPPGPVDLIANYTAFADLRRQLADAR